MRATKFIDKISQIHLHVQETLHKSQEYQARHDQHRIEKSFKMGDKIWLQLTKERLQGLGKAYFRYTKRWVIMPINLVYHHICTFLNCECGDLKP